jgi:SH3 domain-containing YSC84-like protein 1
MRYLTIVFILVSFSTSLYATDKRDLDDQLFKLRTKFELMQSKPDKRIPASVLRKAAGVILLDRIKAGFGFAYQGGSGVAMVKDAVSGQWGAPVFLSASQTSFGPQAGGRESFTVILVMDTNAVFRLGESSFDFGGEAGATAGNAGGGVESTVSSVPCQAVMVYSDSEGFYGGAAVRGGQLSPDSTADVAYYGQYLTPRQILFEKKGQPDSAAQALAQELRAPAR